MTSTLTREKRAELHSKLNAGRLPEVVGHDVVQEIHLERYRFAAQFTSERVVLDCACGIGYGAFLLATKGGASKVVGVDIVDEAIRMANEHYRNINLSYKLIAPSLLPFEDKSFDTVVSFETIEHADSPRQFLVELKRVLKEDGTLVISTPNKRFHSLGKRTPWNPFHSVEFHPQEFLSLLKAEFSTVVFWGGQEFNSLDVITVAKKNYLEMKYYTLGSESTMHQILSGIKRLLKRKKEMEVLPGEIDAQVFKQQCEVTAWQEQLEPYTIVAACKK
jgi:ubiquinone/menaquinone biosynthesis C-methylase UbiE